MIDHRLTVFHQLFSWTLIGPSTNVRLTKWSVRKAIWQSEEFPEYPVYKLRTPSLKFLSKWIIFEFRHCKKVHCPLSKFSFHSLIASWLGTSSLSPTVQLDFSWILQMSDRQNYRFARPYDNLSNSLSSMCVSWELFYRKVFANV